jgi:large subunit ribosomal protein L31
MTVPPEGTFRLSVFPSFRLSVSFRQAPIPAMFTGFALTDRSRAVKPDLHPTYKKVMAVCACGNSFETRSTAASIHVEVCAQCHPYFTGKQRLVDTAGRVDRFRRRYQTEPAATPKA